MMSVLMMVAVFTGFDALAGEWRRLPSLPDSEGFAGSFAGVSNGALIVAGGANFPEKRPWEGGTKVWYDSVFVLEKPRGEWKAAGRLPRPLGYGVCATHRDGVVCVGGSDAGRHYADAFRLEWKAGKLVTVGLPSLPKPLANASGALVGDMLYVAGGQDRPDSKTTMRSVWRIDLSATERKWIEIDAWPGGGRMLSVAAGFDGAFWLVGGVDLVVGEDTKVQRRYLRDAYRYHPERGWQRIADLPHPVAAAPTPAPADGSGFYVLGGDDGLQVAVEPGQHHGFGKTILRYDPKMEKWSEAGEWSAPRVTVPCVMWDKVWVVPGGEVRPGVRSPEVWALTPGKKE